MTCASKYEHLYISTKQSLAETKNIYKM